MSVVFFHVDDSQLKSVILPYIVKPPLKDTPKEDKPPN